MGQFLNLLIVLASLGGIIFILYRKIPLLLELQPEEKHGGSGTLSVVSRVKLAAREKILDKTLSKARALAAKTETQTAEWLERLRRKSEQHKQDFSESYWKQLRKKSQKKNNPPA